MSFNYIQIEIFVIEYFLKSQLVMIIKSHLLLFKWISLSIYNFFI